MLFGLRPFRELVLKSQPKQEHTPIFLALRGIFSVLSGENQLDEGSAAALLKDEIYELKRSLGRLASDNSQRQVQ